MKELLIEQGQIFQIWSSLIKLYYKTIYHITTVTRGLHVTGSMLNNHALDTNIFFSLFVVSIPFFGCYNNPTLGIK